MLYHVTLAKNLDSITRSGVDPLYSTGARQLSWFVESSKLAWAILHTQTRHKVGIDQIIVFGAETLKRATRTGFKGVFSTPCSTRVKFCGTAVQVTQRIGEDKI